MDIIPFTALQPERWRNGGGTTRQIAAGPAAGLSEGSARPAAGAGPGTAADAPAGNDGGAPDWRVSIADITGPGPFSEFQGMERHITVIEGEVLDLLVEGETHAMEKFRPFRFSGDSRTEAELPTGPVRVLNVMVRRGLLGAAVFVVELSRKQPQPVGAGQFAVLLHGSATVSEGDGGEPADVGMFDAVVGSPSRPRLTGRGFAAVVSIFALDATEPPAT